MNGLPFEVRDPIYGFIPFDDWERQIINSSPFQRLRRIQQLSLTNYVYPGAVHNRFEHSLGVMHLATLMFNSIINNKKNKEILQENYSYNEQSFSRTEKLIRLAALLHDIGHAPFSHASEDNFPINPQTGKSFEHEDYSSAIIKGPLKDVIEKHNLNKSGYNIKADEVAGLISGDATIGILLFWKELISSQLDADKGDYLLRDSYHLGVKYGMYDYKRLLNTLGLCTEPETKKDVILGIYDDGMHTAESVIVARYQMFTQVYFHKTRRSYDYHLREVLKKFLPEGKFPGPDNIEKLEKYLKFDDYTIWNYIKEHSNDLHCDAILNRKQDRMIYSTNELTKGGDQKELKKIKNTLTKANITFREDQSSTNWYKLQLDKQIMIINKQNFQPTPLSKLSELVHNIGMMDQTKLYVSFYSKDKAKELIYD
jgi:HD superfamily phosphohydrolase